jgi:hypothetical protein
MAPAKIYFVSRLKRIAPSGTVTENISLSYFQKSCFTPAVPPRKRGVSRPSRTLRWDAVGVSGCSVVVHADEQHDAHGQVVWFWPPGAEVKLVTALSRCTGDRGKNAGPWGEREVSRKAIARGMPGVFG